MTGRTAAYAATHAAVRPWPCGGQPRALGIQFRAGARERAGRKPAVNVTGGFLALAPGGRFCPDRPPHHSVQHLAGDPSSSPRGRKTAGVEHCLGTLLPVRCSAGQPFHYLTDDDVEALPVSIACIPFAHSSSPNSPRAVCSAKNDPLRELEPVMSVPVLAHQRREGTERNVSQDVAKERFPAVRS